MNNVSYLYLSYKNIDINGAPKALPMLGEPPDMMCMCISGNDNKNGMNWTYPPNFKMFPEQNTIFEWNVRP